MNENISKRSEEGQNTIKESCTVSIAVYDNLPTPGLTNTITDSDSTLCLGMPAKICPPEVLFSSKQEMV